MKPLSADPSPSFENLWAGLNSGDKDSARLFYQRFIDRMIRLAAKKLKYNLGSPSDPESVAQSVFQSFFEGIKEQQFEARNWGMVFGLLAHITFRKCLKRKRAEMRERRNPGKPIAPLDEIQAAAGNTGPDEMAIMSELLEVALGGLDTDERAVVDAYMGGQTTDAVARKVGLSIRTVQRVIERFSHKLEDLLCATDE